MARELTGDDLDSIVPIMGYLNEAWPLLVRDRPSLEMLDMAMQEGYQHIESGNNDGALLSWKRAWEYIRIIAPSEMKDIREFDELTRNHILQSCYNWCQDYELEVVNNALSNDDALDTLVEYTSGFVERFPQSDVRILVNFLRNQADCLIRHGQRERGFSLYRDIIKDHPDDEWGYIGLGDILSENGSDEDLSRVLVLYKKAVKVSRQKEIPRQRLSDLEARMK